MPLLSSQDNEMEDLKEMFDHKMSKRKTEPKAPNQNHRERGKRPGSGDWDD